MMKVVVALCVIFAVTQAAHTTNWYSGSVNSTGTPQAAAVVVTNTPGPCTTVATGATGYRNFTVNVTNAGFFYFSALFEKIFKTNAQIQVYNGPFTPATACTNLLYAKAGQSYVPHIEFVLYLTPGLYPVVVTGPTASNLGLFAVHVDVATLNGATNELTSPWWYAPSGEGSSYKSTCDDSSYPAPYTHFNWWQNGTQSTDILYFGYNSTVTSSWDFSAGLYNNTNLAFIGSGNRTNPTSGCNTPYFIYQSSTDYSDLDFHLENAVTYQASAALGVTLTNGMNYSIVIGTYDSYVFTAMFGVFMRPTSLNNLGTQTFTAPVVPALSTTTDCTPGSDKYYGATWFTALFNAYILDNPTGFFDTAGCLYLGLNTGNATAVPNNCPSNTTRGIAFIQCGDTGDGGPVANFLVPGVNYTWLNFPYSGSGTAGAKYLVYNYSGKLLGVAPVTTTGVATTGMMSSDASSVGVMFALFIAAMFF